MGERGNTLRRREHAARVFSSHSAFVIPVVHRRDAAADPGLSGRFDGRPGDRGHRRGLRVSTLRRYAAQAGFPVGRGAAYRTPAWRFYRLQHPGAQALHSAPANGLTAYYSSIFAKSAWRRVDSIARSMAATIFFPRR